jgi:hypothetical protein
MGRPSVDLGMAEGTCRDGSPPERITLDATGPLCHLERNPISLDRSHRRRISWRIGGVGWVRGGGGPKAFDGAGGGPAKQCSCSGQRL